MCASFQKHAGVEANKGRLFSLLILSLTFAGAAIGWAQGDPAPWLRPSMAMNTDVRWMTGPAKASIGQLADLDIPRGYRFIDSRGAQVLLQQMKNPVPRGLVGIVAPEVGGWWVILEFNDTGYVKEPEKQKIDAAAVLQSVRNKIEGPNGEAGQRGAPAITSLEWAQEPQFDATEHVLEWAVRAESAAGAVINHTVRLLGRSGVLDVTAVQRAGDSTALIPLRDVARSISFKPGQQYADYRDGDRVASMGLTGLIAGADMPAETAASEEAAVVKSGGRTLLWAGSAGAVLLIGVVVTAGVLRRRRREDVTPVPVARRERSAEARPVVQPVRRAPAPLVVKPTLAVATNGNGHHHRSRKRRKMFNYTKFYSEMVLQVSGFAAPQPGETFGLNGTANGNSHAEEGLLFPDEPTTPEILSAHHRDLINDQRHLIQEQQRFIQEQTKLMEEKARLIRERTELLERQSELFERDVL